MDFCHGHSHDHEHNTDGDGGGIGKSLRSLIDIDRCICYNEDIPGSGQLVLSKNYVDRLSSTPHVQSPMDDVELLFHIPFTEAVSIQSISIHDAYENNNNNNNSNTDRRGTTPTSSPRHVKLFVDQELLDFESARESPATMELELLPPIHFTEGTIDYPLRPAGKFSNISSIQLFFLDNYDTPSSSIYGEDNDERDTVATSITYIGLKGFGTNIKRQAVETVYESRPIPKDHQVPGASSAFTSDLGGVS
jgi:hypothetical protein